MLKPKGGSLTPRDDKNQRMSKILKKFEKNCKIIYKFAFLAIGCLSVASHGGQHWGGGCTSGWWGVTSGLGGQQRGGEMGAKVGGSTVGVSSTSKNRPSHHKYQYKSPKEFELKQSWKSLGALNARWALPVYPVFEDEKSTASDEKLVKRKIALKKDRQD